MDIFSAEEVVLESRKWRSVRTGISIEVPKGVDAQIRPRSGLAREHGLTLLGSPLTVFPGDHGELLVPLINFGTASYRIRVGDRIAQLIVGRYPDVQWKSARSCCPGERSQGGFGAADR